MAFALVALFCVGNQPAIAQDVLVVPKNKEDKKDEKSDADNSWLNFVAPKPDKNAKPRGVDRPVNREKQSRSGSPILTPNPKSTGKITEPELPIEAVEAPSVAAGDLNALLMKMKERPTQVIQQPEYTPDKNRKFANEIGLEISKLNFSREDLEKTAEGTAVKPDELLKACEPRFTGVALGHENAGVDFELRGNQSKGMAGYEKGFSSIHVVLSLACKLAAPPRNKGTIPRMGESYILGVAQGGCTAERPINNGRVDVSFTYEGGGTVSCTIK